MQGHFRTHFEDGTFEETEAVNSSEAKLAAKNKRYNEVDPSRTQFQPADRERHPRIKVTKVEEITAAAS